MKTLEKAEKAYTEIFDLIKKHKDICNINIKDFELKKEHHLFGLKLKEYGLNIDPLQVNSLDWVSLGEYINVSHWGNDTTRFISAPDDGIQPDNELLICISFPTGAYSLGGSYPTELFNEFFLELKTYKPKYIDSANKSLYFSMDNAKDIFNKFSSIYLKYVKKYNDSYKLREIKRLEAEIVKLNKA